MENKTIYTLDGEKFAMILADKTIPSGAKLLLFNLIYRLGGKDHAFPSQRRIADDIGLSERMVRYHLDLLRKRNILYWKRGAYNPRKKNMLKANEYHLGRILKRKEIEK